MPPTTVVAGRVSTPSGAVERPWPSWFGCGGIADQKSGSARRAPHKPEPVRVVAGGLDKCLRMQTVKLAASCPGRTAALRRSVTSSIIDR